MRTLLDVAPGILCKPEDLRVEPLVVRVTKFNHEAAKDFQEAFSQAHETGQPFIPVLIDSFGGEVYSFLDMAAQIRSARLPVVTVVEGKAMSAGAMLFGLGKVRVMAPHATLMLHDVSDSVEGKLEDLKVSTKEAERLQALVFGMVAKNLGHPPDYFNGLIQQKGRADWYLDAAEATAHKLATHVGVLELRTDVSVTYHASICKGR